MAHPNNNRGGDRGITSSEATNIDPAARYSMHHHQCHSSASRASAVGNNGNHSSRHNTHQRRGYSHTVTTTNHHHNSMDSSNTNDAEATHRNEMNTHRSADARDSITSRSMCRSYAERGKGRGMGGYTTYTSSRSVVRDPTHPFRLPTQAEQYSDSSNPGWAATRSPSAHSRGQHLHPSRPSPSSSSSSGFNTIPSSHITPFVAAQAMPAQHGAAVVRSGSAATEGGSVLFFSSVQKRGGAYTRSEREVFDQVQQSNRAAQRAAHAQERVRLGTHSGSTRNATPSASSVVSTHEIGRRFAAQSSQRHMADVQAATVMLSGRQKRSRFVVDDDDEEDDDQRTQEHA